MWEYAAQVSHTPLLKKMILYEASARPARILGRSEPDTDHAPSNHGGEGAVDPWARIQRRRGRGRSRGR